MEFQNQQREKETKVERIIINYKGIDIFNSAEQGNGIEVTDLIVDIMKIKNHKCIK